MKRIFIIAIIVRLLIIPFFYHPDIKSQHFHFQFLKNGIFDIYTHTKTNNLPNTDTFNYLPLTYFTFGTSHIVANLIAGPSLDCWLNDWGPQKDLNPKIPLYLFSLKIPYLILDLAIALLILKIYSKKLTTFYLFNPISIYLIYILGNFDVFPVFLTFLSFYLLKNKKNNLAFLSLGIAIAIKLYPLIFFPFFLFLQKTSVKKIIKHSLILSLPLLVSLLPFLSNQYFWQSFFGSGLSQKILAFRFHFLPLFPFFYFCLFLVFLKDKKKMINLEYYFTLIFILFLSLVDFHPQWLLWFFPFTITLFYQNKSNRLILSLSFLIAFVYIFLFNDNYLFWGHLIPIDGRFVDLTSPYQFLKTRLSNLDLIRHNLHRSLFFLAALLFINHYRENK